MTDKADFHETRQYIRTTDKIPVYYELYNEKVGKIAPEWELMFDEINPKPEDNPKLYELLFDISQKLDILLSHLSEKSGFNLPEVREVNISGGGLCFFSNDMLNVGEKLLIKTFLPTYSHIIRVKCEVVRAIQVENGYEIAVKFFDLDEITRDKIIRYIFARQRKTLNKKS